MDKFIFWVIFCRIFLRKRQKKLPGLLSCLKLLSPEPRADVSLIQEGTPTFSTNLEASLEAAKPQSDDNSSANLVEAVTVPDVKKVILI